mmetsp:Transcript_18155/g.41929  ORF Transcript_18155/g.41929 Transcript_18155/m.41929 type:complete len:86 (+) Transcript_18155:120-377(+)
MHDMASKSSVEPADVGSVLAFELSTEDFARPEPDVGSLTSKDPKTSPSCSVISVFGEAEEVRRSGLCSLSKSSSWELLVSNLVGD